MSPTTSTVSNFVSAIASRRSIYPLAKGAVIPDEKLIPLVQEIVRQSPSSFNSQSSRVVFLLGKDHDEYWNSIVHDAVKGVSPADQFEGAAKRLQGFAAARLTILFYEAETVVQEFQKKYAVYADRFPQWSEHSSGMAQINVWTALANEGLGCNLQHYGNLTEGKIASKWGLPQDWKLKAELVVGEKAGEAGEKSFMDDAERFKVFGGAK